MTRREALRLLAYTGVGLSGLSAASSFFAGCARRKFRRSPLRADRYGVTLLVDGLRADLLSEMLDAGALPNIKKHLVDRGTWVENCVSTFPSTTGPAHLPFITGVMPGYNNCPGLRWIDRGARSLRDYCTIKTVLFNSDFPATNYTMYEVLYDTRTVCIFDFVSRGASDIIMVPVKTLWFSLTNNMEIWNEMDGYAVDAFRKAYKGGGDIPRYSFVWMPAIDHLGHFHGCRDQMILDRLHDVDGHVGRLMETLQEAHLYDQTLVSLVADHGLRDTARHVDLRSVLGRQGFKVLEDLTDNDQFNSLAQNNAVRGVSGNAFALLYFAPRREGRLDTMSYDWSRPPGYQDLRALPVSTAGRVDLVDLLRREDGIELVMVREKEDSYLVFSRDGEGRITRDFGSLKYTCTGSDPLGYADNPDCAAMMDGGFHDKDDWFLATRATTYPDGVFQISQLFDSERCGDLVITARDGWDLMDQDHVASHGGMDRAQIQVPCVVAGPGVRQGTIPIARTVDLYPTYLKFLGIPYYDGEVLNVFM